jgi:hypothetical protein
MLSCQKITETLSKFEGGQIFKIDNFNPLFEQSSDFDQKYLQLVEDKIKENGWVDPAIDSQNFPDHQYPVKNYQSHDNQVGGQEQKSINLNYREHQTCDLPNELLRLISPERHKNIYFYGMKGPDSFLASVLLAKDPGYWFQHRKKRNEYANELKTTFNIKHHDLFREIEAKKGSIGVNYKDKIFENDFPQGGDSDKSIELQFLIGHSFNVNILVLDLSTKKGHFATDWDPTQSTVILIKDVKTYLPILSGSGEAPNFTSEEVKEFDKGFQITYPIKMEVCTKSKPKTHKPMSKETTNETPKETLKETSNETPKETPKETLNETPKETPKETLNETPKETLMEALMEKLKETLEKTPKDIKLLDINSYKVSDLLDLAKTLRLDYMKRNADGKKTKQTKAELYDNISNALKTSKKN